MAEDRNYEHTLQQLHAILKETAPFIPHPSSAEAGTQHLLRVLDERIEKVSNVRWGWSTEKEPETWSGNFLRREDAMADAQSHGHKVFFVCSGECPEAKEYVPELRDMFDIMIQKASDAAGEAAEDFPDVSPEAEEELEFLLRGWAAKFLGRCSFWIAKDEAEKIDLMDEGESEEAPAQDE